MKLTKNIIYPWIVVACCCLLATASIGIAVNCMGVYYSSIAEDLNVGLGQVSIYLTILNLTCGFCGPVVINLTRKIDLRVILAVGGLGTAVSYIGLANVNALWQVYGLALLQGVLTAMSGMVIVTTLVSNWFNKAMGIAAGISLSFSGLMGAILSPIFNNIIQTYGWRTSYYVAAAAVAVCVLPAILLVRLYPSELKIPQYGNTHITEPVKLTEAKTDKKKDMGIFKSLSFILIVLASFFATFIAGFGTHVSNYATSVGIDADTGALMVSAVMVGNMISKFAGGFLCDILKPKRAVMLIFGTSAAGCLMMAVMPGAGTAVMLIACFLLGTSYSICGVGLSTMSREIFGAEKFASAYSYVTIAGFVGSAIAFSVVGFSYDLFKTFVPALIFCTAISVLSLIFILIIYKKAGRKA